MFTTNHIGKYFMLANKWKTDEPITSEIFTIHSILALCMGVIATSSPLCLTNLPNSTLDIGLKKICRAQELKSPEQKEEEEQ
jgi:hypothetical protein